VSLLMIGLALLASGVAYALYAWERERAKSR
jgi:hypothetical protein